MASSGLARMMDWLAGRGKRREGAAHCSGREEEREGGGIVGWDFIDAALIRGEYGRGKGRERGGQGFGTGR